MKAAAHAAARIDSMLMAKGKLRGSDSNNKHSVNGGFKTQEVYTAEFEINEAPPSARTLLTKGYVQEEINAFSGATVSTRGRFMTEQEKQHCTNERSLYLYIQGHTKQYIDMAVQKISEIIKTEHQSSLNRPSRFTNAPPPLMSLDSPAPTVEKICIGIENAPEGFDLRGRIIGAGGTNLLYIRGETGASMTLRGRGSRFVDPILGTESSEPLHLHIEHTKPDALQNAKQLAINLIQTLQSELQSYIQQQLPPVQTQQSIEQSHIQQIQQAQFQTMNIGTLGQPNVVTIQHQDIIQHPQSSVMTLPTTILTATVAGPPGGGVNAPPPGVHIPTHSGPLLPTGQPQDIQTFIPPPPVGQVQLIGPPPTVSQVQYQFHPAQPLQIQGVQVPPPGSQSSPQSVTQMYVMSQPPPQTPAQQNFIASSSVPVNGAISYVYTQPNMQRPPTPSQNIIETVDFNLQQPPPPTPMNMTQQPPPPLLHLHFPPPNFPHNYPPPPIPQTYQIQYQQVQTPVSQSQTQLVLQSTEHLVPQMQHSHESVPPQHSMPPRYEGQHPPQFHLQVPPPPTQTFMLPNALSTHQHQPPPPSQPPDIQSHEEEARVHEPPQPVLPPQMVPPPPVSQGPNNVSLPAQVHSHQAAPWLYQTQLQQPSTPIQVQLPPSSMPMHGVPPPQMHAHIQYHTQQVQYQNGQMQTQVHYMIQPPPTHSLDPKAGSSEHKPHGMKRKFADAGGLQEPIYQCGPPPIQHHGFGDTSQRHHILNGSSGSEATTSAHGSRNKLPISSPHEEYEPGHGNGCGKMIPVGLRPQVPWQPHPIRGPWVQMPPLGRDDEHRMSYPAPPPTNMPPPQIRPLKNEFDGSQSPHHHHHQGLSDHHTNIEYHKVPLYSTKPPAGSSVPLMQSIFNPPPPPPPLHQQRPKQHQPMQTHHAPNPPFYHPPVSGPPWVN